MSELPRRTMVRSWSSQEVRAMRELADQGWGAEAIAARLRRTVSAVRNKAGMHGISLQRMRPAEPLAELA
ncbi:MAG TPA: hypothetical protein VJQ52_24500 [Steroidobacteraceae bacterium]|nr:hypothetical protein [Steroidobacteraceae bacterium]